MNRLILALFLLLGIVPVSFGVPAKSYTFTSGTTGVSIGTGNASSYPWQVTVSGVTEPIRDIRVRLTNFTHTNTANLDICLVDPSGNKVMLMSDMGSAMAFPGVTNTTMQFSDFYPSRNDSITANANGFGTAAHPFNNDTADDSFGAPFPGAPYTGPFGYSIMAATNGSVNGTWSLYIVNDTASGGATTACTVNTFNIDIDVINTSIVPINFYASTSGSTGNTGLSPSSPWPLQYALTNRGYCTGDKLYLLGGTYTGINNYQHYVGGLVAGGTNTLCFAPVNGLTNNALEGMGWFEILPYQNQRVIIDNRRWQFQTGPTYIHDLEFIDSTANTRATTDYLQSCLEQAAGSYNMRVENCLAFQVAQFPGTCAYNRDNYSLYLGLEAHEHGMYAQLLVPLEPKPYCAGNLWVFPGGSAIKGYTGGYNLNAYSNVIVGAGRISITSPLARTNGYTYGFWHNPSAGYFETNATALWRNYLIFPSDWESNWGGEQPLTFASGVGDTYTYQKEGGGCSITYTNNYYLGRDDDAILVGTGASDGYLTNSIIKYNTFALPTSARFSIRTKTGTQNATADWDFNSWIFSTAPGSPSWQWNGGAFNTTLSAWTNATVGGPAGKWDINSTAVWSDTTFGGNKLEVYPDLDNPGRGFMFFVNNTGTSTPQTFNLSSMGFVDGQRYTLVYGQALRNQATWVTNTYNAASPTINLTPTAAAYPHVAVVTQGRLNYDGAAPNMLPRFGAWISLPAPTTVPTPTLATNVGRTQMTVSWNLPSDTAGVRVYMRSNSSAWRALQTVDAPTTSLVVPIASAQTNDFVLSSYSAYSESAQGTIATDPISLAATPTTTVPIFRQFYNIFFRMLLTDTPRHRK